MISNTNKLRKTSGFTIVELLIVIVVIGILAAITIVAYNGVQARANNTKLDTLAKEIADKAEVYAADNEGTYPTLTEFLATPTAGKPNTHVLSGAASPASGAKGAIQSGAISSTTAGKIQYLNCGTGAGYTVTAYDYTTKTAVAADKVRKGGNTATPCS